MDSLINKAKSIKQLNELNTNGINTSAINFCLDELIKMIKDDYSSITLQKSALINYILPMDNLIEKLTSITNSNSLKIKTFVRSNQRW